MSKGIIYYTDNELDIKISDVCQKYISESELPITSCSLKSINFGKNIVLNKERSYPTMIEQIFTTLKESDNDYVFFCEHDCLYPKTYFNFTPPSDNTFYYNANVWRWLFGSDRAIRYERMLPLSALCVNRNFALNHYKMRLEKIQIVGLDKFRSREPQLARRWGYEPGTKKIKRGGLTNDDFETWESEYPIIDIRHKGTFSPAKVTLDSFKHQPVGWKEIEIDKIPGWNLRKLFSL